MVDDAPEPEVSGELHGVYCATYQEAIELVGRRWSGVILRAMLTGATRFSEIRDAIPELTDRMLSERLKELEQRGITQRRVEPTTPVRITYHLTAKGEDLRDALIGLQNWAERWAEPPAEAPLDVPRAKREIQGPETTFGPLNATAAGAAAG